MSSPCKRYHKQGLIEDDHLHEEKGAENQARDSGRNKCDGHPLRCIAGGRRPGGGPGECFAGPGSVLRRPSTPNGATTKIFKSKPFHPECILVRFNLLEESKDDNLITFTRTVNTKTTFLLWPVDIVPRHKDTPSRAMAIPKEAKHHLIDSLQDTS